MATSNRSRTRSTRTTAAREDTGKSKTEQAYAIFKRLHGKKSRKEILEEFQTKVGLAPTSSSTYYQKFLSQGDDAVKSNRPPGTSSRGRLPDESSKAGIARKIFAKMQDRPRKEVLEAFIEQAELTPAGASTYYQKLKHAA